MFLLLILLGLTSLPIIISLLYKRDILSPINIFSFLYSLSFGLVPLLSRFGWIMTDPAYAIYNPVFDVRVHFLAIAGILLVYLAYYEGVVASAAVNTLPSLKGMAHLKNMKLLIVILFLISGLSFLFFALFFDIKVKHIVDYFIYTNISAFGRGHLAFLASLYLPAGFIAIMGLFNAQTLRHRFFFFVALFCTLTMAILSKSRGQILILLFVVLIFYHYRIKRIGVIKTVGTFCIMLFIVFTIAQLRSSLNFHLTKTNIANTFGGLFEEHQATATLLSEYTKNSINPSYGKIFLEETVMALIPRKIWTTKPEYYGGIVITDAIVPNRQQGFYYAVGPFGLAYADFGYVGIFISMLSIGFVMRIVYEYLQRNKKHNGMLLWYALFCFDLWAFMRGGWGFMSVILKDTILVIFMYYFISHTLVMRPRIPDTLRN